MKELRILHCYAEGRPGNWMAICLDLDVAVDGPSLEAVVQNLEVSIKEYCDHIATLPQADQERLLSRKAPLGLRIKFLWHMIRALWIKRGGGSNPKGRAEFVLPAAHCRA